MRHIVLLGDSVFDNAAYVHGGPDVRLQIEQTVPRGDRVTLLAVDGHSTSDVLDQAARIPRDASHLIVSGGGNDALSYVEVLSEQAVSVSDALARLRSIQNEFGRSYSRMLRAVLNQNLPTTACTIYDPRFPEKAFQEVALIALTAFNDVIIRLSTALGLPILDLRLICNEAGDYANPIEPSEQGGSKIAAAIWQLLSEYDFSTRRTQIFK